MKIINTSKISKVMAWSALVFTFSFVSIITIAVPQAHAYLTSYNYGYHNAPSYYPSYTPTYYNTYSQVGGSCYAQTTSTNVGQSVTWYASAYGGNGNYSYSWSGADGLYGYGSAISYAYNTSGTMTANVAISSNGQTSYISCNNSVAVYSYNYNTNYNYNYSNYSNPLAATCSANTTSANLGQGVTWTSNVSGGNGYYSYTWSGSDGLYGSGSSVNTSYNSPGSQYAQVTVYSNGQSIVAQCTNAVNVGNYGTNYNYGYTNVDSNVNSNSNGSLTIGCAADTTRASIGTPVTWSVEVEGGSGAYTYAWSGTDGLAGSQTSVATTYESAGQKNAVVIVTSSNGQTGSKSCPAITVLGAGSARVNNSEQYNSNSANTNASTNSNSNNSNNSNNGNNSGLSAASLFSISNIPWGWVAVLIILVLFGTVMYLVFNKSKI